MYACVCVWIWVHCGNRKSLIWFRFFFFSGFYGLASVYSCLFVGLSLFLFIQSLLVGTAFNHVTNSIFTSLSIVSDANHEWSIFNVRNLYMRQFIRIATIADDLYTMLIESISFLCAQERIKESRWRLSWLSIFLLGD